MELGWENKRNAQEPGAIPMWTLACLCYGPWPLHTGGMLPWGCKVLAAFAAGLEWGSLSREERGFLDPRDSTCLSWISRVCKEKSPAGTLQQQKCGRHTWDGCLQCVWQQTPTPPVTSLPLQIRCRGQVQSVRLKWGGEILIAKEKQASTEETVASFLCVLPTWAETSQRQSLTLQGCP